MFSFPSFLLASSFSVCIWVHIHFTTRHLPLQTWRPDLFLLCVPPVSPSLLKCIYCLSLPPALCCVVHACSPKFLYLHVCELPGFHLVLWITFVFWVQIIIKGLLHVLLLYLCSQPACHSERERKRKHCLFIYLSASYLKDFFSIKKQNQLNIHKPIRQRKEKSELFFYFVFYIVYLIYSAVSGSFFSSTSELNILCAAYNKKAYT